MRFWRAKRINRRAKQLDFPLFSASLFVSCQLHWKPTNSKNWYAKHIGAFARQDKSDEKSMMIINPKARSKTLGAPQTFGLLTGRVWSVSQVARGLFRTAPCHSWLARGVPRSARRRLPAILETSPAGPAASAERHRTPKTTQN